MSKVTACIDTAPKPLLHVYSSTPSSTQKLIMSTYQRLAVLEALVRSNNEKIEELQHTNWLLTNYNTQQQSEIAQMQEDLGISAQDFDTEIAVEDEHISLPESPRARLMPLARPPPQTQPSRRQPSWLHPPGPAPTPFYLAAREANHLQLDFVIPGYNGETLGQSVNNVELAFILQQTLRRRGWGEVMTRKEVEDFLECPMVKVTWRGRKGEFGRL
jgi:hypothetical protein